MIQTNDLQKISLVDHIGRVVIPSEMRTRLNIKHGDKIYFWFNKDSIIISNTPSSCYARKLDKLGRIVIPREVYAELGIELGGYVLVKFNGIVTITKVPENL